MASFTNASAHSRAGLVKRGIKPGEYVLIHLDNWIEAVLAWFACVELGAIAVTTNTRSAAAEMEYFAGHCGAVAAITQPAYAELISANCRRLRWIAVISHDAGNTPAQGAPRGDRPCRAIDPSALCSVQYTSGTTSRPKAVLWTHANALWGAKINAAQEDPMPDEVPVVFIIPHAGVDSAPADLHDTVMATCRTSLADFKVPREIHFVDDMPRSTLEKVAKAELRKMLG